jgi:ketosteroid isomerase-like protein
MRNIVAITPLAVLTLVFSGCNKPTPATGDSAAPPSTTSSDAFNESEARSQILAADSAFVRAILAKNVDSLMPYYDPSVVSLGKTVVKGTADVRTSYLQAVKTNPRDISFQSNGVNFSNDHSMAWDYGTVTQTNDGPGGKPVKASGTFLNVWKNVGGRWLIVAEINSASP